MLAVCESTIGATHIVSDSVLTWSRCVSFDGIAGNGFAGSFIEQRHWSPQLQGVFNRWLLAEQHVVAASPQHDFAGDSIEQQHDSAEACIEQQFAVAALSTVSEQQPQSLPFMPNGCHNSIAKAHQAISCFVNSLMSLFVYTNGN